MSVSKKIEIATRFILNEFERVLLVGHSHDPRNNTGELTLEYNQKQFRFPYTVNSFKFSNPKEPNLIDLLKNDIFQKDNLHSNALHQSLETAFRTIGKKRDPHYHFHFHAYVALTRKIFDFHNVSEQALLPNIVFDLPQPSFSLYKSSPLSAHLFFDFTFNHNGKTAKSFSALNLSENGGFIATSPLVYNDVSANGTLFIEHAEAQIKQVLTNPIFSWYHELSPYVQRNFTIVLYHDKMLKKLAASSEYKSLLNTNPHLNNIYL